MSVVAAVTQTVKLVVVTCLLIFRSTKLILVLVIYVDVWGSYKHKPGFFDE